MNLTVNKNARYLLSRVWPRDASYDVRKALHHNVRHSWHSLHLRLPLCLRAQAFGPHVQGPRISLCQAGIKGRPLYYKASCIAPLCSSAFIMTKLNRFSNQVDPPVLNDGDVYRLLCRVARHHLLECRTRVEHCRRHLLRLHLSHHDRARGLHTRKAMPGTYIIIITCLSNLTQFFCMHIM
jgi:hypothetical protein